MKNNEVVAGECYWWQPERDSVTGALPPKQKATVVRKTGIAVGEAQDYGAADTLRGPTEENRRVEIKTEHGKKEFVKVKELSPLEDCAEQ